MIAPLILIPPALSLTYAIAVHLFLSSFHERSIGESKHWWPICIRLGYCLAVTSLWFWLHGSYCGSGDGTDSNSDGSCSWSEMQTSPLSSYNVITALGILANAAASLYLIAHTRRKEVDGPPPPFPANKTIKTISMQNNVVLITGANTGIGLETARQLHDRGAIVIFACRSRDRALAAMRSVDPSFHLDTNEDNMHKDKRMIFLPLDLTFLNSVRKAVELFEGMNLPLHILINNAGVMRQKREVTEDGLEMTMAANHFGHFLLTNLLLPKLRQTALETKYPSKVITVSSSLYTRACKPCSTNKQNQRMQPGIDLDDLQCQHKQYTLFDQYAQSKLANVLFARELARREKLRFQNQQPQNTTPEDKDKNKTTFLPIQSYTLHPGLVRTDVVRNMPWYLYYPNIIFGVFMWGLQKTPRSGAYTTVFCAAVDDFNAERGSEACYYVNSEVCELSEVARSVEDGEKLWKLSCDLVNVPYEDS